jgi:hypothetical protein
MKHVIDIQDYGGNRVARLLPAFRLRFDENHIHVCRIIFIFFYRSTFDYFHRLIWNNLIV